jgi:hypothetical protein
MRNRSFILTAVLAVLMVAWATPAHALAPFVQFQDSKDAGLGYGFGLKHTFLGIVPIVGFDLRASWLHYSDEDKLPSSFETFPLEVAATAKLGIFYGGLGVGYYINSGDIKPDDEVGGFAAAGAGFKLLGLGAFAELRYLLLEPGNGDMSGVGANVGVTLPL